ncbi:MAG: flagellar hook-associated protein FlgL [Smithellaceae bacterium]
MITRVTENIKFNMINNNLFNVESQYGKIMEKLSTQKNINRPSDDPIGTNTVLDYRTSLAAIDQYNSNIADVNGWISMTETKLNSVNDIITQASEIAVSQGSATASADTRNIAADTLSPLIDEILSLANSKYGDSYLFGGSKTNSEPFSSTYAAATVGTASSASSNNFDGTIVSGGTYTASANKTYVVKIVDGGTLPTLADATYKISADGGKTWGTVQTDLSVPITLGDGMTMTFTDTGARHLATDDLFKVSGYAAGYYRGNNDQMSVEIGKNNNFGYNLTGGDIFTTQTGGSADLFLHLNDLKTALQNNDAESIRAQIDTLKNAQTQVTQYQASCGSKINSLDTTKSNHDDLNQQITSMMSTVEDADVTKLITDFQMKQIAMQASYNMAAQIGKLTILDYLK